MDDPRLTIDHPLVAKATVLWVYPAPLVRIRTAFWSGGTRGTVYIFTGRTEYIEKYYGVISKFLERDFSVVIHDWRGQGLSTRNSVYPYRGHVDHFHEYQNDLSAVLAATDFLSGPRYLFAHSMGAMIGLQALQVGHKFHKVIFSSPMWGIWIRPLYRVFPDFLAKIMIRAGLGWRPVPGTNTRQYECTRKFEGNYLTGNSEAYHRLRENVIHHPELKCAGPTHFWFKAAREAILGAQKDHKTNIPTLVLLAEQDQLIDLPPIRTYCADNPGWACVEFKKAQHEIYLETPEIQKKYWREIDIFLDYA